MAMTGRTEDRMAGLGIAFVVFCIALFIGEVGFPLFSLSALIGTGSYFLYRRLYGFVSVMLAVGNAILFFYLLIRICDYAYKNWPHTILAFPLVILLQVVMNQLFG